MNMQMELTVMAGNAVQRQTVLSLRETIARIEDRGVPGCVRSAKTADPAGFRRGKEEATRRKILPLGVPQFDEVLQGGLPLEGMMEIRNAETRDAGAAAGFVAALAVLYQRQKKENGRLAPVLWISQTLAACEAGQPYAPGLKAYGLDAERFLFVSARTVKDALWIAETALSVPVFAVVVLEIRGNPACLALSESRRLHVRARAGGVPLLVLRQAGEEEASSAFFRLQVKPAPAGERPLPDGSVLCGSIGHPAFHLLVEKSRRQASDDIFLEWNAHDRRFYSLDERRSAALQTNDEPTDPVDPLSASADRPRRAQPMGRLLVFARAS
ncbi:ImuA family protein [Sinorhizobium meliloti]|uniref:ImuA family protein n=1 Tax=Rhizobium meliloti TaxID=382 RepID=UPI0013E2DC09|nr:ImuA family protein [Sinorhizobium meliloti]